MKILLAPSETKQKGGSAKFDLSNLFCSKLNPTREILLSRYEEIVSNGGDDMIDMFGLKKESDITRYKKSLVDSPTLPAICRYTGVAFDYLDFESLPDDSKEYIYSNVIIFSNLFGVVLASNLIPDYRLKQGKSIGSLQPEKIYNKALKEVLDDFFKDEEILDIRANYYNKFYKPKTVTTLKFLKDGKVVSHWAKAYRGLILKELAKQKIKSIDEFLKLPIEGLELLEIHQSKTKKEIIYNITI